MEVLKAARAHRLTAIIALSVALLIPFSSSAQAPGPSGVVSTPLLGNDRISAIKLSFAPGGHETVHTHPFDIVVIQLTAGDVDFVLNGDKSSGHIEPGRVTYIPAQAPHSAGNSGNTPFDMVVVALR